MVGHWVGLVSHIHLRLYRLYIVLIALVVHIFIRKKCWVLKLVGEHSTNLRTKQAVEITTIDRDQHAINCKERKKY